MSNRPTRLHFVSPLNAQGNPRRFYLGVPARDLDAADLAKLGDDKIAEIMGGPYPVYIDPDAEAAKAKGKEASKPAEGPAKAAADGAVA